MRMIPVAKKYFCLLVIFQSLTVCLAAVQALGGPYRDSAHGNSVYGVNRSAIDSQYNDFATGNCAHCHEMHASRQGAEPVPVTGPAPHALFAMNFNEGRTQNSYLETDNFCFSCHNDETGPLVVNQDYSATFGGAAAGSGPQSIYAAFNQTSYHNLYDIWSFMNNAPDYSAWFAGRGNPCSACHNPHLAKRNWDDGMPDFPLLSAITQPGGDSLWGETELMSAYSYYEPPFSDTLNREPAGVGLDDGSNTPDYVGFCTTCHSPDNIISSTSLSRQVKTIDWGGLGLYSDKHGEFSRDGTDNFREPYATSATTKSNFVLSCLDCHEAHGSENIMLLRRRINGENLEDTVLSIDAMSYLCKRCHNDDLATTQELGATAGTGEADRWEYIHHGAADAPYPQVMCGNCHGGGPGSEPISCGNCHGHGQDDSILGANASGRKTF